MISTRSMIRMGAVLWLVLAAALPAGQALIPKSARHGMVVTTQRLASEAGLEVLKRGGNAIDAAVATAFVLAVVYPSCGNIGGEGFLLFHRNDGFATAIDFRTQAPAAYGPGGEKRQTTHFSVVDGEGNAVSLTTTMNGDFGAYLVPQGSGVVLNNSLPDFDNRIGDRAEPAGPT